VLFALLFTAIRPVAVIFLNRYIFNQLGKEEARISIEVFKKAIKMQWTERKNIEEGEFVNLVTNAPSALVRGILVRGSVAISGFTNLIVIVFVLLVVDTINTLFFLTFTIILIMISNRIYNRLLTTLSTDKVIAMETVAGIVNVGWKTARLLKIMPSMSFDSNYYQERSKLGLVGSRTEFLSQLPRSLFEIYLGLSLLSVFILSISDIGYVSSYGSFGAAAFRIFPIMTQIQAVSIQMKIEFETAVKVKNTLSTPQGKHVTSAYDANCTVSDDIYATSNLSFRYLDDSKDALRDINISVKKGEKVAIVGSSGSGKTTLLNVLIGFLTPTSGTLRRRKDLEATIGYVPQASVACGLSIANSIALEWDDEFVDYGKVSELISEFNNLKMFEENKLRTSMLDADLSGGQQQALGIMRALYRTPDLLILDEPSSALDEHSQKEIMEIIFKDPRLTIIMVTHRKETLNYVDRIVLLDEGRILTTNMPKIL
jgi:ABC-type multidrug transport system fused ATPase/permease subunit